MQTQWYQHKAVTQFSAINIEPETDRQSNQLCCTSDPVTLFALRDQSVEIASPLIDNLKSEIADARSVHLINEVKNCGAVIDAFLEKGIADIVKAQALTLAINKGECDQIEAAWNDFISNAMNTLFDTLNNHTKTALKDVPNINQLLASVKEDYSLYDLSIERNITEQQCDLVFQNADFFCHIQTSLFAIENKALQYFYKQLLERSLCFGGIWQEDLIHTGFMDQWTSNNPKEIAAAEKVFADISNARADNIDDAVEKSRDNAHNKDLFSVLDEMIELQFCGDTEDKEDFKEWLEKEVSNQIKMNNLALLLSDISKKAYSLSDCPRTPFTEQIKKLLEISQKHVGNSKPSSFVLDEDNFSNMAFVLQNHEENSTLNNVSQEQYEQFCNAGEDNEVYRLDLTDKNWLDDLKEMTLALNIMFVAINAMTASLPDNQNV